MLSSDDSDQADLHCRMIGGNTDNNDIACDDSDNKATRLSPSCYEDYILD